MQQREFDVRPPTGKTFDQDNWFETLVGIDATSGSLPCYSYLDPSFAIEPNDQHSPHNVIPIADWRAIRPYFLATLRDWLQIRDSAMLPSQPIAAAPTVVFLITRDQPRDTLPAVAQLVHPLATLAAPNLASIPVNDLQVSMIAAVESVRQQRELPPQEIEHLRQRVSTLPRFRCISRKPVWPLSDRKARAGTGPNSVS